MQGAQLEGADLREGELQGADFNKARLAGATLQSAQLHGASLRGAELQGGDLYKAQLEGASLHSARLQGAVLRGAGLQGADLEESHLLSADLLGAQLQGAALRGAELQAADIQRAQLQGADLAGAQLQGADLSGAQLNGANLRRAQLQGAFLRSAELQGTDLRDAALWRAILPNEADAWRLADVRGFNIVELGSTATPPEEVLDRWLGSVEQDMPVPRGGLMAKRLKDALLAKARPGRPDFPIDWRSQPTLMFEFGDPESDPFDWGQRKWSTEEAYDEDLARYLGDLACGSNVPEAQARGLAQRALDFANHDRLYGRRLAVRITGPDCPPASGLPEELRGRLEKLAALDDRLAAGSETSRPDPAE